MSGLVKRVLSLVTTSAGHVAFNPVVTAALLWVLTKGPPQLRSQLTSRIAALRDPRRYAQVVTTLKWCLAFGTIRVVNKQMNHVALNAGRIRSQRASWNWGQEVAVITGGCSGIGELVVARLVHKGVKVAVLDIQQLPPSLQGYADVKLFTCDITNPSAVYSAAEKVKATFGAPTILINNAGILAPHTILTTSDDHLRKIFDVNVLSNWYTTKAFLPDMLRNNKGHIVTVASLASFISVAGMVDYTATKAAILSFHEGLNQELKLHYNSPNVLTTSIHPNWVRTPLLGPLEPALRSQGSEIIEPAAVADTIVDRIVSCTGGQICLPNSAGKASLLRGLPNWIQESVRSEPSKLIFNSVK